MNRHSPIALLLGLLPVTATAQNGDASYELVFQSTWSAQTHPVQFPPGPHYSSLIGGTHDDNVVFWQPGGIASSGIERMAELGSSTTLANEVTAAINAGTADKVVSFSGLPTSPALRTGRFAVNPAFPRLTLVSMIAPSPDWFIGTHGLELLRNGQWTDNVVVPLDVYDAGTDSGTTYLSANQNTSPKQPIAVLASGPFQGQPGPVGSYTFRRVWSTLVYGCANPAGTMRVFGKPVLGGSVQMIIGDPNGVIAGAGATALVFAASPDAAFPCGTPVAGIGLTSPGSTGEVLLAPPMVSLPGDPWNGGTVTYTLAIPNLNVLVGQTVYVQGAIGTATQTGVADAVELLIGSAGS